MSFGNEVRLVLIFVLVVLPFNPTNIFVDMVIQPVAAELLTAAGVYGMLAPMIPWFAKAVLALMEVELVEGFLNQARK